MRAGHIRAKTVEKWRATTDAAHPYTISLHKLNRQFAVAKPNRVWADSITYLWTAWGWLYLAMVLDLYSRRIIAWVKGGPSDAGACHSGTDHSHRIPTVDARRGTEYRPWVSVRRQPVPRVTGRSRPDSEHESARKQLHNAVIESFFQRWDRNISIISGNEPAKKPSRTFLNGLKYSIVESASNRPSICGIVG